MHVAAAPQVRGEGEADEGHPVPSGTSSEPPQVSVELLLKLNLL